MFFDKKKIIIHLIRSDGLVLKYKRKLDSKIVIDKKTYALPKEVMLHDKHSRGIVHFFENNPQALSIDTKRCSVEIDAESIHKILKMEAIKAMNTTNQMQMWITTLCSVVSAALGILIAAKLFGVIG